MGQVTGPPKCDPIHKLAEATIARACPVAEVKVDDIDVKCLVDTGSQVTLFSESLCKELFKHKQTNNADLPWLTLRAANGLKIPYVGYMVADFKVGGITVPSRGIVIVRDDCLGEHKALLGMNVIWGCWDQMFKDRNRLCPNPQVQNFGKEWDKVFADCRRIQAAGIKEQWEGTARVACRYAVTVPAQSEALLWARVSPPPALENPCALVEPFGGDIGVEVSRTLVMVKGGRVPVKVRNVNPYPITLYKLQKLATVSVVDPLSVREGTDVSLTEVSPGVVEVGVVQAGWGQDSGEADKLTSTLSHSDHLSGEQQHQFNQLLAKWRHVFSAHEEDYGHTDIAKHHIPTGDAAPIRERFRPLPPTLYKEMRTLLQGMLDKGVIKESCSPWAAPIVLVQKKCGAWRFCVDYRKLNSVTHKDAFPLPRIEDSLTSLTKAEWYTTLDLASGYWQVELEERDKEKTAFTTPLGLFQFERMPFGLCNAPATFQRLMQRCLGNQLTESALVYLDDVVIFSPDFATHLHHLETVFQSLARYGLKLRPEKCQFFRKEVKFLGHVVSGQGVSPDPEKVTAVQEWNPPTTAKQVHSFLGFVGYYRRFIKDFAKIAKPLHELLVGRSRRQRGGSPPINWTNECEAAFQSLKQELLKAPILAYADFTRPFTLYTDASHLGLGAVLAQEQDGQEKVIAYASRSLRPAERNDSNYSSFKLELLAMKWAIVEKFKDYLWGAKVTVITDNNPLVHLQTAKLAAVEQRWAAQLANFDYTIKYRPGREHTNADVLSRLPTPHTEQESTEPTSEELLVGVVVAPGTPTETVPVGWGWDPSRWKKLQEQDDTLRLVRGYLHRGWLPRGPEWVNLPETVKKLLHHWRRLHLRDGVVCRNIKDSLTHETLQQVVVPADQTKALWEAYHSETGHQGVERMMSLLRRGFYWSGMEETVNSWTQTCPRCVLRKAKPEPRAPLVPIVPKAPLNIVSMDFLTLSRPTDRYQNILVITDLFTKYAWAIPTADQTAITTARALWNHVIQPFGCPETLHSDQGPNFKSKVISELCNLYGCRKSHTTPYHPQGNGVCERFNQTLLNLLGTLEAEKQNRWPEYLPGLVHAYNNSVHSSTGYAPTYLMFGRHTRLPIEMVIGTTGAQTAISTGEWVGKHAEQLSYAYSKTSENLQKAAEKNKRLYDKTARDAPLLPGERVLVLDHRRQGKGKLSNRWEDQTYVVVGRPDASLPVYKVRPEGQDGPQRTLHRNHLRPCLLFPLREPARPTIQGVPGPPLPAWGLMFQAGRDGVQEEAGAGPGPRRSHRANLGNPPLRYR